MKKHFVFILFTVVFLLSGCDRLFEYSPYSANVRKSFEATTAYNLQKIKAIETETGGIVEFKVGMISESHLFYNGLIDINNQINEDE